jgi:hypothetical protein
VKQLLSILFLLVFSATISAQKSRIVGKVTNSRNEALASVTVKLSGAATAMTRTDVEGRFSFVAETQKKYTLTVSYVGYQEKIIDDVTVSKAGEDETVNIILNESSKVLSDVSVKATTRNATAKGETVNELITFQKNTNTVRMFGHFFFQSQITYSAVRFGYIFGSRINVFDSNFCFGIRERIRRKILFKFV